MNLTTTAVTVLAMLAITGGAAGVAYTQAPTPSTAPSTATATTTATPSSARDQVFAAERAFAASMRNRDLAAFTRHLSKDAIFYGQGADRGPVAITAAWKAFFDGPTAPFSWEPTSVEVVDSGTLALSSGPVRAPDGRQTATFNSVWRLESDGVWRVVFDKGCQCPPPVKPGDAACAARN